MIKPKIGITRRTSTKSIAGDARNYHDRIIEAGGEAVDLQPTGEDTTELVARTGIKGILVAGGADIDPLLYGEPNRGAIPPIDIERDRLELGLIRATLRYDLPLFAICRGHQLLNVVLGGGLLQDLPQGQRVEHRKVEGESSYHEVSIVSRTKLSGILKCSSVTVNSRHHQAVRPADAARALTMTAFSHDGIVEAMESSVHRWVVSVQWHPERDEANMKNLFMPVFVDFVRSAGSLG